MTARTQIGTVWGVGTQTGSSTSLVAPAHTITAGSLVRCIIRGESSDATATATDTAGADWVFVKARDSNVTVWLGYSWNHPGGTNVVVTVSFSGSQSYRSGTFVEHSGGDASDPYQSGSLASSVGSGAMNLSVPFTGDVSVFAGQGNYSNTSYTAVNGVLLQTTGYHACLIINSTGSSPANPSLTGSSGGVATIAAAFSDPAGGGSPTVDLAVANAAHGHTAGNVTLGTADMIEVEVTGLDFEGIYNACINRSFAPKISSLTVVYWEKRASGHNTEAYFGGFVIGPSSATPFDGPNTVMQVDHNCPGTFNTTTGQRDAGVGSNVTRETAAMGSPGGQDRIASESALVLSGETQQSFNVSGYEDIWVPRAFTIDVSVDPAIVVNYADCRTMTDVIRSAWDITSADYTAPATDVFFGAVPWSNTSDERYQSKWFGPKIYTRVLTDSEILTKLFTFADDTADPDVYYSNVFPAIVSNVVADNSGKSHPFDVYDTGNPPVGFTETVTFTIPSISVPDLVVANARHEQSAESPTITTDLALAVASATHAHAADSPALTTDSTLAVQDSTHGHSAENLTLSTVAGTDLVVADASHAHAAEAPTLTTDPTLSVDNSTHDHSAESPTISVDLLLTIANASHAHAADNVTFSTDGAVAVLKRRAGVIRRNYLIQGKRLTLSDFELRMLLQQLMPARAEVQVVKEDDVKQISRKLWKRLRETDSALDTLTLKQVDAVVQDATIEYDEDEELVMLLL